jgi:uncharacterized protein YbjT (DUF2867 family)
LRKALEGVDRAFLLTNSSERVEAQQIAFVEAAQAQRVGHVVYLSQFAADLRSPDRFLRYHGAVEAALTNSTVGWTFVRPNLILQAYLPFAPVIARGELQAPNAIVWASASGASASACPIRCDTRPAGRRLAAKAMHSMIEHGAVEREGKFYAALRTR